MVRKLIEWAVSSPLIVLLFAFVLAAVGGYAFFNVNVEAYPDPAPAIIEVVAQYPGASAEEVERQVTIPLEVALAGMPGLQSTRSKSLFGLAHLLLAYRASRLPAVHGATFKLKDEAVRYFAAYTAVWFAIFTMIGILPFNPSLSPLT